MKKWSYAILGTGALGGLYGGLLAKAGYDVHFLVRSDYGYVKENGLLVESPIESFHLKDPQIYLEAKELPIVDVVIVAWKTVSNGALEAALRAACGPETIVLVLQNGLNSERDAAQFVGEDRVLGGCCFLCSNKIGPGHIRHLDYGAITFGEYGSANHGTITERMQRITDDFRTAKIDMNPAKNLRQVRWKKLCWNIPFNGLSVVLRGDTQQIMADENSRALAHSIMLDVQQAAGACNVEISDGHVETMLSMTHKMVPYHSSMSLDFQAKRPIEVESIFGNPLRSSVAAGYRPRFIEMLYQQLCFLDQVNRTPEVLEKEASESL